MKKSDARHPAQKIFYVKSIVITGLTAIIALQLLSSLPGLYRSYGDYREAKRVHFLNDVSDDLFTAVGNYGFERGRVNVVLSDAGPVEAMEPNRKFIAARRRDGDNALQSALEKLGSVRSAAFSKQMSTLKQMEPRIAGLREEAAKDLVVPRELRQAGLADTWFAAMTAYIEKIEALLVAISDEISNADGIISRYSSLKHEALALRNTAGPEMSILSATIRSGEPIKPKLRRKIETLRTITEHHFQSLSYLCQGGTGNAIPIALEKLKQVYYADYAPYRDEIFPLSLDGGPYPYSQEAFLGHGVTALREIAGFMGVIVSETKAYATDRLRRSRRQILFNSVIGTASLVAVILTVLYLNIRVIRPIRRLTSAVRRLSERELNVYVPFVGVQNEIGEMARSLEIFKAMALQLEKDIDLLREAEEKVRKSEEKQRRILNNLPDMIIEVDSGMKVLWANSAALAMNPDAIGRTCYAAFPGRESSCDGCCCVRALETGNIETGIMYQPSTATTGESYWENIGIPLPGLDGDDMTLLEVSRNVTQRVRAEAEKERLIRELKVALAEVKTLSGLLPICSFCKKIRDDEGYWDQIESYIQRHSAATFSHSICRECAEKYYPGYRLFEE